MTFDIQHYDPASKARAGVLQTDHGQIQTPIFMPVGTAGSVKAVHQRELKEDINAQIIFIFVQGLILSKKQVVCINSTVGIDPF
jgi:tRNA-guanine family transglycosylase